MNEEFEKICATNPLLLCLCLFSFHSFFAIQFSKCIFQHLNTHIHNVFKQSESIFWLTLFEWRVRERENWLSWPNVLYFFSANNTHTHKTRKELGDKQWNQWMKHECIDNARNNNNENKTSTTAAATRKRKIRFWIEMTLARTTRSSHTYNNDDDGSSGQAIVAASSREKNGLFEAERRQMSMFFGCAWKIVVYRWNWRWMKTTTTATATTTPPVTEWQELHSCRAECRSIEMCIVYGRWGDFFFPHFRLSKTELVLDTSQTYSMEKPVADSPSAVTLGNSNTVKHFE